MRLGLQPRNLLFSRLDAQMKHREQQEKLSRTKSRKSLNGKRLLKDTIKMKWFHKHHNLSCHINENTISFKYLRSDFISSFRIKWSWGFFEQRNWQWTPASICSHMHFSFTSLFYSFLLEVIKIFLLLEGLWGIMARELFWEMMRSWVNQLPPCPQSTLSPQLVCSW